GGGGSSSVSNEMGNRFFGPSIDTSTTSETSIQEVLPTGGTLSKLRIFLTGDPGTGDSYTFTVPRDPPGVTGPSNTTITCTISGNSATSCEDTTHSVVFEAGDAVSILATETGGPSTRSMYFRLSFG